MGGVLATFALYMHHQHTSVVERNRKDLQGLAFALSEHLEDLVQTVDATLVRLADRHVHCQSIGILAQPDALVSAQRSLRGVQSINVLDAKGAVIHSTWLAAIGMDRSKGSLFSKMQGGNVSGTIVDTPFKSMLTGKILIPMGLRLETGGQFCGSIVALIEPERLSPIYLSLNTGNGRAIWLLQGSKVVARFGGNENDNAVLPEVPAAGTGFRIEQTNPGGAPLLVAYDSVGDSSLTIAASIPLSSVLADWQRDLVVGVSLFAIIGTVAFLLLRMQHRGQRVSASREAELKSQSEARRILFDTSVDVILVLSEAKRVLQASPSVGTTLGIAPDDLIGQMLADILRSQEAQSLDKGLAQAHSGTALRGLETQVTSAFGRTRWLSWSIVWSEGVRKYFLIGHDRTDVKQREQLLVAQNRQLDAALENMSQGLAMFDRDERLIVANDKFALMYGQRPEDVKPGTTLSELVAQRIESGLYVGSTAEQILERMRELVARRTTSHLTSKMGNGRTFSVSIQPQPDGGWVATHLDVSDREHLKDRLDTALNNMAQGLAMFDKDWRLIVSNDKFALMYGQSPSEVKPGIHFAELVAHRVRLGLYSGTTIDAVCANMREMVERQVTSHFTRKLGDGRSISVSIQPQPDGGWVATHLDISDTENLKDRLDTALNHMAQGLAMFDEDYRLVVCNKRYLELYDLPKELGKPGTPALDILRYCVESGLYLDRDPEALFEATHKRVSAQSIGYFESQLSNGRVCGVSFSPMGDGGVVMTHEDITQRRQIEAQIAHLAHHDALTDLPNRALLRDRLDADFASGRPLAVMYLDLDRFKVVNDTLGHNVGDKLLRAVGERLKDTLRENDLVARLGGDEFAILHYGSDLLASSAAIARRVVSALNVPFDIDNHSLSIGTSVGIAIAPTDANSPEEILRNADLALYAAKTERRGTYSFFDSSMNERLLATQVLELELRNALVNKEFYLEYQPICDLETGDIKACEALLRWAHPRKGRVPPIDFIPLAEQTGLINEIGAWVLHEACEEAARWPEHIKIAVNLSPVQVKGHGLVGVVQSALESSWLTPSRLELEITETTLLGDNDHTLKVLSEVYDLGAHIALDDFGTGYSSLGYLQMFPFHKIKVDRSFINAVQDGNPTSHAILRTIAFLGQALGMVTTVEGVENEDQLAYLRQEKFDQGQGYYFSHPLAPKALPWRQQVDAA